MQSPSPLVGLPEDKVRTALEKTPAARTAADVSALLSELGRLHAFAFLPQSAQRAFCRELSFREYLEQGAVVVSAGAAGDAWWVVLSGAVVIIDDNGDGDNAGGGGGAGDLDDAGVIVREGQPFGFDTGMPGQRHPKRRCDGRCDGRCEAGKSGEEREEGSKGG